MIARFINIEQALFGVPIPLISICGQEATLSRRLLPVFVRILSAITVGTLLVACSSPARVSAPSSAEAASSSRETVVAQIGDSSVLASEFLEQYRRTASIEASPSDDTLAAWQDFLERYVDYRLKVREARAAGYGELPDLNAEIQGYREQLARPYLLREEVTEPVIREMHRRRTEMVEASHILIRVAQDAAAEDTLAAYRRLLALADSVRSGVEFGRLAQRNSEDPSARFGPGNPGRNGYLGFFGGGRMVDAFEDAAYATAPGELSGPVRTPYGYHLILVHDRREMPGEVRIAHIMIQPGGRTAENEEVARERIDEVLQKLESGADFAALAAEYSDDSGTARSGGELQRLAFDAGLPVALRDSAYALAPGETSGLVETPYGFHVVRMLERYDQETFEEAYDRLLPQVSRMPRAARAEAAFARKRLEERDAHVDTLRLESLMRPSADSLAARMRARGLTPDERDAVIATLADSSYTLGRFAAWFRTTSPAEGDSENLLWSALDGFLNDRVIDYEIAALELSTPDFARTMTEFRDGLMLFRLMEDSVWTAASLDSLALEAYHAPRAASYRFPDRIRVVSVVAGTDSLLLEVAGSIRTGASFATAAAPLLSDTLRQFRVDTTFVENPTGSVFEPIVTMAPGEVADPVPYEGGFMLLYHGGIDAARERTFEEARALVVNDYQDVLEERLIARLRDKYQVETYPDRLVELLRQTRTHTASN